jgi:hypothetical protein
MDVHVEFVPNNSGSGAQSPTVSAIDPAGDGVPFSNADNPVTQLSKLRSVQLCSPFKNARR